VFTLSESVRPLSLTGELVNNFYFALTKDLGIIHSCILLIAVMTGLTLVTLHIITSFFGLLSIKKSPTNSPTNSPTTSPTNIPSYIQPTPVETIQPTPTAQPIVESQEPIVIKLEKE
jgi:hypothetical protein